MLRIRSIEIILPGIHASDGPSRSPGQQWRNERGAAEHPVAVFPALECSAAVELIVGDVIHGAQLEMSPR